MEVSTNDIKTLYRSVYSLVKQLDDQKCTITTITQLLSPDLEKIRLQVIDQSELLIFLNYENIGKKSREIFWRKGYYDLISLAKRLWTKAQHRPEDQMIDLIQEGIENFKKIIVKIESDYLLDLRHIIDFSLLDTNPIKPLENGNGQASNKSLEAINYALETVHASLLSLGDLHRYYVDFKFINSTISRDFAAKYYYEAFKLNPKIGMAQNQLGTLYSGQNYDLDSTYHYLYSLICIQPFELSENNVAKIFQANSKYLVLLEDDKLDISVHDFLARFILIVDIFFYDKDVTDFNALCYCMLMDFRKLLQAKRTTLSENILFNIVGILFFCMAKLKLNNSSKIYSLNAFMIAICSELVDSCIINLDRFIIERSGQNFKFQGTYSMLFDQFDQDVKRSREDHQLLNKKDNSDINNREEKLQTSEINSKQSPIVTVLIDNASQISTNINNDKDEVVKFEKNNESDIKPAIMTKTKKKDVKLRRRRKRMTYDDSDTELSSHFESDFDMNSDFSSDESLFTSSCSSSDSEIDDDGVEKLNNFKEDDVMPIVEKFTLPSPSSSTSPTVTGINSNENCVNIQIQDHLDSDDIIVEEEKIIYLNEESNEVESDNFTNFTDSTTEMIKHLTNMELNILNFSDDDNDVVIEEESIVYTQSNEKNSSATSLSIGSNEDDSKAFTNNDFKNILPEKTESSGTEKPEKLRYKRKYSKIDPNVIIEFAKIEPCMQTLKIMFDWLKINNDILINCYFTNPEFIHKIMKFLNHFNIDIFTRKVYFDRKLIRSDNVRDNLRSLFDIRISIPLQEDLMLKNFCILDHIQHSLDWEIPLKMVITENEENILRVFKLVDFGFFMCKMKKYKYNFCAHSRQFIEVAGRKERTRGKGRQNQKCRDGRKGGYMQRKVENGERGQFNRNQNSNTSNDEKEVDENKTALPKKSYLKNRNHFLESKQLAEKELVSTENKYEIMGKLWLRNEVKTLESKIKKPLLLTPYLVMDSKSLTEFTSIVKNLIRTKKFIVLIPSAVFSELDELKKNSENARNTIRWLEKEFSKGSRFLRPQRSHETLPVPLLKIPKKLDRDSSSFLQIAQFCNYIKKNHSNNNDGGVDILTLLTGDNLIGKKSTNISYTGIMNAVAVNFEQITSFYLKYKKK